MDILLKGIPDGLPEANVKEWVAILVERFENQKLNQIQAASDAVKTCQTNIDNFRKQNTLTAKFEKPKEVEEPKES